MKKISRLALALLLCAALLLCSCGNQEAQEAAKDAFAQKFATALALYDAVYGAGLPAAEGYAFDPNGQAVQYAPVSKDAAYKTLSALQNAIEESFSAQLSQTLCRMAFSDLYMDGSSTQQPSEGEQTPAPSVTARYKMENGVFYINLAYKPLLTSAAMIPDFDSVGAGKSTAMRVVVTANLYSADRTLSMKKQEFVMVLEDSQWRFDSAPYISQAAALL